MKTKNKVFNKINLNKYFQNIIKKNHKFILVLLILTAPYLVLNENLRHAMDLVRDGWPQTITSGDQHGIYLNVKQAIGEGKIPDGIRNGWMSPGYLAMVGFYHQLSWLWSDKNIDGTFVLNGVFYSALAALIAIIFMVRVSLHQSPKINLLKHATISAFCFLIAFKTTGILRFSWLPWSHYVAAFLSISLLWVTYEYLFKTKPIWIFFVGFFSTLLLFSRRHEAMAIFVAMGIVSLFNFKKLINRKNLFHLIILIFSILFSLFFIDFFSNHMPLNSHYAQQRAQNSYIDEYMRLYPLMIPTHIIQTFFDPNYFSYDLHYSIHSILKDFETDRFSMPMILQMSFLIWAIPFSIFAIFFFIKNETRKKISPAYLAFVICFFSASIIFGGYLSTAVWGGPHLQNGLIREFISATLALIVATGPALSSKIFKFKSISSWRLHIIGLFILSVVIGQVILPNTGLPKFTSTYVGEIETNYQCTKQNCNVDLSYYDRNSKSLNPPYDHVLVRMHCPNGIPGKPLAQGETAITLKGTQISFKVIDCPSPVNIEIYPLFTGYCGTGNPAAKWAFCNSNLETSSCSTNTGSQRYAAQRIEP